jgi:hypothetical protein
MKGSIVAMCLTALLSSSVAAVSGAEYGQQNHNISYWNPVTIYNDAPYDIQYSFSSLSGGNYYFLNKGKTDVYHSGIGDSRAELVVNACTEVNKEGACLNVVTHITPVFYDVGLIKAIHVKAVNVVTVTCLDGGALSCIVK